MSDEPKINGRRYTFASVELSIGGVPINGLKSITYQADVPIERLRVPPEFRYHGLGESAPRFPIYLGDGDGLSFQTTGRLIGRAAWRLWKRNVKRNRTRSSRRTDFGRRFG